MSEFSEQHQEVTKKAVRVVTSEGITDYSAEGMAALAVSAANGECEDVPEAPVGVGEEELVGVEGGDSPVAERKPGPAERLLCPKDVIQFDDDDEIVYVVGTKDGKVTKIEGLENMRNIKQLILRCCLISSMDGVQTLETLTKLELYDNQIERISCVERLQSLVILDISFNSIRDMSPVASLPLLEELYIAQNKLRRISGLENMKHLRILDLGANRIRDMDGLQNLTSLKSLWLGKNKIEHIKHVEQMTELTQLDVQNNRLTSLYGLQGMVALEELYLAHNRILTMEGLPTSSTPTLKTIDLSSNGVTTVEGIEAITSLEELWMSSSQIKEFDQLGPLLGLKHFTCIYLEHSPLAADFEYRMRLLKMIPTLTQIDAVDISHKSTYVPSKPLGKITSDSTAKWNHPDERAGAGASWNSPEVPVLLQSILASSSNFTLPTGGVDRDDDKNDAVKESSSSSSSSSDA